MRNLLRQPARVVAKQIAMHVTKVFAFVVIVVIGIAACSLLAAVEQIEERWHAVKSDTARPPADHT